MTISSATRKAGPFLGNGVTNSFPFTFKVFQASDIQVVKTSTTGVDSSPLILNSDYSIALNADQNNNPGGTITYPISGTKLATGEKLTVTGVLPDLQGTHITNGGNFFANNIEDQMDYLTILVQQHSEKLARALLGSLSDLAPNFSLGTALQRIGRYLGFDSNGDVSLVPPPNLSPANGTPAYARTANEIFKGISPVNLGFPAGHVWRYGAAGDGVVDDLNAFSNALLCNQTVYFPATPNGYRLSAGITVPAGVTLFSDSFLPGNPPAGAKLLFDLSVATCLTLGGPTATNGTVTAFGFTVTRAAGAIPAGSIGILVQGLYNVTLRDLFSTRHARPWRFYNADGINGISSNADNLHSSVATDVHWEFDGWPEFRCNGGRTGMNGTGDQNCNGYIRIQGGTGAGGSGPNTIKFNNHQFNQGVNAAANWLIFNHPVGPGVQAIEYAFVQCHVESCTNGISSDASTASISQLIINSCRINITGAFFALNAATQPSIFELSTNEIYCSTFVLNGAQINSLDLIGNYISASGSANITGASNSTAFLAGNTWVGSVLTLAGSWNKLAVDGEMFAGGSGLTLTATGPLSINLPGTQFNWTPGIGFGAAGGTFNGTYTSQVGRYTILNNEVNAEFVVAISAKGSTVGVANITGLPFNANSAIGNAAATGSINAGAMTGLTGGIKGFVSNSTAYIQLTQSAATGDVAITDTSFTATAALQGRMSYML